jgi:hypothetical protein
MALVFAQHATAGKYHLETRYVSNRWEWYAAPIQKTDRLPEFSGEAKTLEAAMNKAMYSIGLAKADWMSIGPAIEMPD